MGVEPNLETDLEPELEPEVEPKVEADVEPYRDQDEVTPDVHNPQEERQINLQHKTNNQSEEVEYTSEPANEEMSNGQTDYDIQDLDNNNCVPSKENILSEAKESNKSNEEKIMLERLISMVQSKINFAKESKTKEN